MSPQKPPELPPELRAMPIPRIDPRSGVPVYKQMLEQMEHLIASGQLPPGAQLVSVRQLAGDLKVNPMTVSKVYTRLELSGLVERRPGIGLFVAEGVELKSARLRLGALERPMRDVVLQALNLHVKRTEVVKLLGEVWEQLEPKGRGDGKR
ncbi:MAG: GntR family transcriptional regulator [Polyangiaceae bacterium]|nr:GntR family transcriptional regulator [Polyangiaceae bacterium]